MKNVTFIGDTHYLAVIPALLDQYELSENRHFIHIGDFGTDTSDGTVKEYTSEINTYLKNKNSTMWVIRGNHDNPKYFEEGYKLSNLEFIPDFTIRVLEGLTCLFVGGAISVDRLSRILDISYFKRESFNTHSKENIQSCPKIDLLVSHMGSYMTRPTEFASFVKNYLRIDESLEDELREENQAFDSLLDELRETKGLKYNIHGHYHISKEVSYDDMKSVCLRINQLYELRELLK